MTGHPPNSPLFPSPPLSQPPACPGRRQRARSAVGRSADVSATCAVACFLRRRRAPSPADEIEEVCHADRKSTRLNSSHSQISYAVFCLKKKNKTHEHTASRI